MTDLEKFEAQMKKDGMKEFTIDGEAVSDEFGCVKRWKRTYGQVLGEDIVVTMVAFFDAGGTVESWKFDITPSWKNTSGRGLLPMCMR